MNRPVIAARLPASAADQIAIPFMQSRRLMVHPFPVLIIEDDADTRSNLCDILELDGHQVFAVSSFQESESVARSNQIGLVITDRRLPEGMIEEFLPQVQANSPGAEVVVVTGFADMQSTIAAIRLGVTDYVIKPIIPEHIRGIVNRLAEQDRLQAALAEEHQFADEVLRTAEAIILVLDPNGNVIRFNPYFEQMTGWKLDQLVGKNWFEICIPEDDRDRIRNIFVATAHDIHTRGVVNDVRGKDGVVHKIRWSNTTLKKVDGSIYAVLAVGVDVSDLADAQSRALRAERLAAIGQTMTALAHESRNALQRIKAAADVLALEVDGNKDAQDDLQAIQRASGDLQKLLEEVRSFAAPIQIHAVSTDLVKVWQRVWNDIAPSRDGRDVELVETADPSETTIDVDSLRMEQVFRNLFENSLAACSDPVRIEVEFRIKPHFVELVCSDNGPGLNDEQKQKMFEPFFTTKATGTGLGMSICQRIIEAHAGSIHIDPSDEGARFVIRLPRKNARDSVSA